MNFILKNNITLWVLITLTACTSTKYKIVGNKVFYAEALSKKVSVHCSPKDSENDNSITYLYLIENKRIDTFIYRRPWPYETCLYNKEKIQKILNSSEKIRILGMNGDREASPFEKDDQGYIPDVPQNSLSYSWFFDRIEGHNQQCHGYFEQSCIGKPFERFGPDWVVDI